MELYINITRFKWQEIYKNEKRLADFSHNICSFRMFANRSNITPYRYFTAYIGNHTDRNTRQFNRRMSL